LGGFDVSDGFDDFDDHMAFYGSRRMSETETPYHVDDKVVLGLAVIIARKPPNSKLIMAAWP